MKKNVIFFLYCLWGGVPNIYGQLTLEKDIISNAGDFLQTGALSLDWTMGEISVETYNQGNLHICQGFHQGDNISVSIDELNQIKISIYPNPTVDKVFLTSDEYKVFRFKLFDINGRVLKNGDLELTEMVSHISLNSEPTGIYILHLIDENLQILSYKILKTNQ